MLELAILLFGIFCGLLLYGLCFNGGSVTPENKTDQNLFKCTTQRPSLKEDGTCAVCGFKGAHGWECMGYFMNLACSSYLEHVLAFKKMLEDIQIGRSPSKLTASLAAKKIEATKELMDELTKV